MFRFGLLFTVVFVVAACSGAGQDDQGASTTESESSVSTSTMQAVLSTTSTSEPVPETTSSVPSPGLAVFSDVSAIVMIPDGEPPFPAVVAVHGGGFHQGSNEDMTGLSSYLRDEGFLVFNTNYQLSTETSPGFPAAVHDVACAVRLAANHELSDGTVVALGYSAGAHLASLVALTGDGYGTPCPELDSAKPDRLVALGLPDLAASPNATQFVGPKPDEDPERWVAADPQQHVASNPELSALFIHAENDSVVPISAATSIVEGLNAAGAYAALVELADIGHFDLVEPKYVSEVIIDWLHQP